MITEKTIQICGKDVQVRYCLASETGFEVLSGKEISVFLPTPTGDKNEDGTPLFEKPKATTEDFLRLAISSIIAAYERNGQNPPVTVDNILYDSTPEDVANLIAATVELRLQWYHIPSVVKPETESTKENDGKNA